MYLLSAPLFGSKHLIGILAILIVSILLSFVVYRKKRPPKQRHVVLAFMAAFYTLEIIKLTYITIQDGSFPIYHLPFQLCSLPLYLYPLMYFIKRGAFIERFVKPAAFSVVMLAGLMALAMPTTILGNALSWLPLKDNVLPIISFTYHGLMIFSAVYLLKSGFYEFRLSDIYKAILVAFAFAGVAMVMNAWLDKDFMLLHYGNGSPFQFINDSSHVLYLIVMFSLGVILISFSFIITHGIREFQSHKKKWFQTTG